MKRMLSLSTVFLTCFFGLAGQSPMPADSTMMYLPPSERQQGNYSLPDTGLGSPGTPYGRIPGLPGSNDLLDDMFGVRLPFPQLELPYRVVPEITAADLRIHNPYIGLDPAFYRSRNFILMPIGMHYLNHVEGGNRAGVGGTLRISDNITANVSTFMSSAYSGFSQPDRILNASLNLSLDIKLAERVTLRAFGQYSAAQGINPALNPMIGTGNYFGGALRVMVTDNFGIEGGFTRSYFMGEWHNSYYVIPIIKGFGGIGISAGMDPFLFPVTQRQMMSRRGMPIR